MVGPCATRHRQSRASAVYTLTVSSERCSLAHHPNSDLRTGGIVQLHLVRQRATGSLYIVEDLLKPATHQRIVLAIAGPISAALVSTETGSVRPSWVAHWRNDGNHRLQTDRVPWALAQKWDWLAGCVVYLRVSPRREVVPWEGEGTAIQAELGASAVPYWVSSPFP